VTTGKQVPAFDPQDGEWDNGGTTENRKWNMESR